MLNDEEILLAGLDMKVQALYNDNGNDQDILRMLVLVWQIVFRAWMKGMGTWQDAWMDGRHRRIDSMGYEKE